MLDWVDRATQRRLLELMADCYPKDTEFLPIDFDGCNKDHVVKNLHYLKDSGLCTCPDLDRINSYPPIDKCFPKITTKGLDFLQDDGGLSAILNVVTVRFEADTLRGLIAAKIDASSEPEDKKAKAKGLLSTLKEEGLKQLANKAMGECLSSLPHIADWVISAI